MKKFIKDILEIVVPALVMVFILVNFILMPCKVEGSSMYPTLKEGDYGYSFIVTRNLGIKRFKIVVIDTGKILIVKRVIGLPNEHIEYIDNKLYIDGVYYPEIFLNDVYTQDLSIQLKDDEYFCLGDNRQVSKDSRFYGPFKKGEILSTNFFVLLPFDQFGLKH